MIETYSDTITEIDDLGGASNAVTTTTRVCDRCGLQYHEHELINEPHTGYQVCSDCLDREGPKPVDW